MLTRDLKSNDDPNSLIYITNCFGGTEATFHLTISMRGQRATGKIKRCNYHHGSCGPSVTGKTSSVSTCQKSLSEK